MKLYTINLFIVALVLYLTACTSLNSKNASNTVLKHKQNKECNEKISWHTHKTNTVSYKGKPNSNRRPIKHLHIKGLCPHDHNYW